MSHASSFQFLIGNVLADIDGQRALRISRVSIPYRQCLGMKSCELKGLGIDAVSIPYRQCLGIEADPEKGLERIVSIPYRQCLGPGKVN